MEIGDSQFGASLDKKLARPYLQNKPGMVVYTCNPNYVGHGGKSIMV
jgi:hypothetical protein